MKLVRLFLFLCLYLAAAALTPAQAVYQADLLVSDGKNVRTQPVEISVENDAVRISSKKKSFQTRSIPLSAIESADYTYSDRPRYTVATLSTIALGVGAIPLFVSKTKKNWLTVSAKENSAILQLQSSNYRMLLIELRNRGVNITDSGDRDWKAKKPKDSKPKDAKDGRP
jgi:hypothetical protein